MIYSYLKIDLNILIIDLHNFLIEISHWFSFLIWNFQIFIERGDSYLLQIFLRSLLNFFTIILKLLTINILQIIIQLHWCRFVNNFHLYNRNCLFINFLKVIILRVLLSTCFSLNLQFPVTSLMLSYSLILELCIF